MAFIPDEIDKRHREITPKARTVYGAHCAERRHKYRVSFASNEEIAAGWNLSLGSVRNAMSELRKKGWIRTFGHYTELLVGDFSEVDKNHPRREIPPGPLFRRGVQQANVPAHDSVISDHDLVNSNHQTVSGDHDLVISDHDSVISDHDLVNAHIEDRARGSQPYQPEPATTSTHTPAARARDPVADAAPVAASPRVCVSEKVFEKTKALCWRYANRNGLGGGWVTEAMRADTWDDDLADFWRAEERERGEREARAARLEREREERERARIAAETERPSPDEIKRILAESGARRAATAGEERAHSPPRSAVA